MKKLPENIRNKLVVASTLPPLEPSTVHCLCGKCVETFYDSSEHKVWRTDPEQTVKEPCEICKKPGYDYTVQNRRSPLNPHK